MTSVISTKAAAAGAGLLLLAAVGATVAFNSTSASGAVVPHAAVAGKTSIFVKIDSIKGQSTNKAHKDAIDATSVTGGLASPLNGRPIVGDIVITKQFDIATPRLLQAATDNVLLKKFEITVDAPQPSGIEKTVTKYELTNVHITSDSFVTTAAGEVEKFSIAFENIKVTRLVGPGTPIFFQYNTANLG
jgi:type VI secretion system Hcp family effector